MAEAKTPGSADAERRKKLAAGLLLVVFVVVIYVQFGGGAEAEIEIPKRRPETPVQTAAADGRRSTRAWPAVKLAEVIEKNPFRPIRPIEKAEATEPVVPTPEAEAAAAAATENRAALNAFASRKVDAIIATARGPAAMIGAKLVREGDVVDGVRIVSIQADGIVVEPATMR